jgi:glucan 1,3-beta-glucosidase
MSFNNCSFGINSTVSNPTSAVGSVVLIDSSAETVGALIVAEHKQTADGSIVLEHISIRHVKTTILSHTGESVLAGSEGKKLIASFIQGNLYKTETSGAYSETSAVVQRSPALLDKTGAYFSRARPQYEQIPSELFSSVRDFGALGDGHTDSTAAINKALASNAYRKVTYFPAGTYIVTDTIQVPVGSRIVGEVWSTIMGKSQLALDPSNKTWAYTY